jgi:thiol-disulfide isomerase/thioredoxin
VLVYRPECGYCQQLRPAWDAAAAAAPAYVRVVEIDSRRLDEVMAHAQGSGAARAVLGAGPYAGVPHIVHLSASDPPSTSKPVATAYAGDRSPTSLLRFFRTDAAAGKKQTPPSKASKAKVVAVTKKKKTKTAPKAKR